ncbi:MAG: branched-chain amino acid ABC transporter permease [Candidatus Rokubacteria bacterium]|nr:branched-chain amino acid ABC transporter permease [Candidatus Rokubacteria bacterium]MBI2491853.1 branched-chain amino acid ABC transporter permease [Candidatus Rokubacteria bacterium]
MSARERWVLLLAVGLAAAVVPWTVRSTYVLSALVFVALNGIAALALSLVMGFAGQVSLGQAAFYAIGAYVSGVLTASYGWNPWVAMAVAVAAGALTAFLVGLPIFRLSGLLLAMATLGFGIILYYVLVNWASVTGGPSGLTGIPPLAIGGVQLDSDRRMAWLAWGALLLVLGLAGNLVDSRVGRALRAIHGSEPAAEAAGVDTARYKLGVFAVAGGVTALAGALYAHYLKFINPSPFGFAFSIELVVMVVLGGVASLWGAVLGAALVVGLVEALRALLPLLTVSHGAAEYEIVVFGLLLMAFMIFLPGGLSALGRRAA